MPSLIAIKQASGGYIVTCLQYVPDLNRTMRVLYSLNNSQILHLSKRRYRVISQERDIIKHTTLYNKPDLVTSYPLLLLTEKELDQFLDRQNFTYLFIHDRETWKVYDSNQQEIEAH